MGGKNWLHDDPDDDARLEAWAVKITGSFESIIERKLTEFKTEALALGVDGKTHAEDHVMLAELRPYIVSAAEAEKRKAQAAEEFWNLVHEQRVELLKWGIRAIPMSLVALCGYGAWYLLKEHGAPILKRMLGLA